MTSDFRERPLVAVSGAGVSGPELAALAEEVGRLLAEHGAILICGGLGGVMAAAARGAKGAGGLTIGLLPGDNRREANPHIDLALATGFGHGRNILLARASEAIIALDGGPGTLSEIALGLKMGRPVIVLGAWMEIRGVQPAATPIEAVQLALKQACVRSR